MTRLAFLLAAGVAVASAAECDAELIARWNRFVGDANAHMNELQKGLQDVKRRARLDSEWKAVTESECW